LKVLGVSDERVEGGLKKRSPKIENKTEPCKSVRQFVYDELRRMTVDIYERACHAALP
jgi:hypothetical protein